MNWEWFEDLFDCIVHLKWWNGSCKYFVYLPQLHVYSIANLYSIFMQQKIDKFAICILFKTNSYTYHLITIRISDIISCPIV